MTLKLCTVCGEPCNDGRCDEHRPEQPGKSSAHQRGYDSRWARLSKRARQIQPWCSTCGAKDDLTADHLRWPAKTLADVDVLCRQHNAEKGAPDGTGPAGVTLEGIYKDPRGMANVLTVGKGSQ